MKRLLMLLALVVTSDAFGEGGWARAATGSVIAATAPPRTSDLCQGWSFVREDAIEGTARAFSATMGACDELGVMALVCTPGWQFFADSESFTNEAKKNIRDLVRWHRNHPSAVLWEVSLNETYGHDSFYEECSNIAKAEYPGGQLLTGGDSYAAKRVAFYDIAYTGWGGSPSRPRLPDARYKKSLHREYGDMDLPWSVHVVERNSESLMALQAWNFQWTHNKNLSLPWTIGDVI